MRRPLLLAAVLVPCLLAVSVPTAAAFTKVAPSNATQGYGPYLTFEWTSTAGASEYAVCYDTSNDGACSGTWTSAALNLSAGFSGLAADTTYYWQVRAIVSGANVYADGGHWWSFTTAPAGIVYLLNDNLSGNSIHAFRVNEGTGALTPLPGFPVSTGGLGLGRGDIDVATERLVVDALNRRLYAVNLISKSISAYSIEAASGALTPLPFSPISLGSNSSDSVTVHPSGSPLVVTGYDEPRPLAKSFAITSTTCIEAHGSPFTIGGLMTRSSAFSWLGDYFYADTHILREGHFVGAIAGFSVAASTGVLEYLSGSSVAAGNAPRGFATDAEGRLFLVNPPSGTVRAFTTSAGVPTPVTAAPTPSGLSTPIHGILHARGGFYFAADQSGNQVGSFRIAGTGAGTTLTPVSGSPFAAGGSSTCALATNPSGTLLFAANCESRNVRAFFVWGEGGLWPLFTQAANAAGTTGRITGMAYFGAQPDLKVYMSGNAKVVPGDNITYHIGVINLGRGAATNVELTDVLPANTTFVSALSSPGWTLTTPGVGATGTCRATKTSFAPGPWDAQFAITVRPVASVPQGTVIRNTASATSFNRDLRFSDNTATATTTVTTLADLDVERFTASPDPVVAGHTLTYTIAVLNGGPSTATGVQVSAELPAGTTFVSATLPAGWTVTTPAVGATGTVTATKTSMALGELASIGLTVRVDPTRPAGTMTTKVWVSSANVDHWPAGNKATVNTRVQAPPTVTITAPTTAAAYAAMAPFLTLAGTASDDTGVAEVTWSSDRGPAGMATGTTTWNVASIPLFAGVNVLTVTARDNDTPPTTAVATLTVTVSEFRYYLAEGATGPFFDLDLAIANPNPVAAPVVLTFLKDDATTVSETRTVPPTSRTTIPVEALAGLWYAATSTVVTSTAALPLLVERSMFWDPTYYASHGGTAVSGPATRWYFAEGSQGYFDTYVLLANANATAATATVQFLTEWAGTVTRTLTLPPTSRTNLFAGAIAELANTSFAIVVEADQPIIAERAMYFGAPRFWEGGHESVGVTAPAREWFLAEGATGFFDEYVLVGNPNATPATVTLTYLLDTGETVTRTHGMAPASRLTVWVAGEDARLAQANVSTRVTADVPVIAERAMYWPAFGWAEAHNSFGVTETALKWGLAEGRVGGPYGFDTYILLANPNAMPAQVRLTFLRGDGTTVVKEYEVARTSRFNVPVNTFVRELANEAFGVVIEVLNGVPIAVERAMYNNDARGTWWAAGTNATGTRLP